LGIFAPSLFYFNDVECAKRDRLEQTFLKNLQGRLKLEVRKFYRVCPKYAKSISLSFDCSGRNTVSMLTLANIDFVAETINVPDLNFPVRSELNANSYLSLKINENKIDILNTWKM